MSAPGTQQYVDGMDAILAGRLAGMLGPQFRELTDMIADATEIGDDDFALFPDREGDPDWDGALTAADDIANTVLEHERHTPQSAMQVDLARNLVVAAATGSTWDRDPDGNTGNAWTAAFRAATGLAMRGRISVEVYEQLTLGWRTVRGQIHRDDRLIEVIDPASGEQIEV